MENNGVAMSSGRFFRLIGPARLYGNRGDNRGEGSIETRKSRECERGDHGNETRSCTVVSRGAISATTVSPASNFGVKLRQRVPLRTCYTRMSKSFAFSLIITAYSPNRDLYTCLYTECRILIRDFLIKLSPARMYISPESLSKRVLAVLRANRS